MTKMYMLEGHTVTRNKRLLKKYSEGVIHREFNHGGDYLRIPVVRTTPNPQSQISKMLICKMTETISGKVLFDNLGDDWDETVKRGYLI